MLINCNLAQALRLMEVLGSLRLSNEGIFENQEFRFNYLLLEAIDSLKVSIWLATSVSEKRHLVYYCGGGGG